MSGIWPGNTQCVAMLTFDVDGVSSWLRRNPDFRSHPSLMSMAEYGPSIATPRILDLLDSYSIKASFYVPGYVAETHAELVKEIARRGHEVGHHGYLHESPAALSAREEQSVLEKGTDILTRLTGQKPLGYRAPGWELSERSIELLSAHGFLYDSSLMGDDAPYVLQGDTPHRLVEIPVHWLLDDAPYFVYAPAANRLGPMRTPDEVYSAWAAEFEGLYRYGRAFTLTMHPQHIGRPGRLQMLERLIRHIHSFPHVEFMRAVDVAQLWSRGTGTPGVAASVAPAPAPSQAAPVPAPHLIPATGERSSAP
jgi:peptidoglycan/xylan/chitin deacetylase (PgdA/CDA1 family)